MNRIEKLQTKLKARENQSGFEKNCEAIRAEISRLTTFPKQPCFGLENKGT